MHTCIRTCIQVNALPSLLPPVSAHRFTVWVVDLPYMVGSIAFSLGAWVQLRMWKAEQLGLGFLSEVEYMCIYMCIYMWKAEQLGLGFLSEVEYM